MRIEAKIRSELMRRELPCNVLLPENYDRGELRYPVLYLLHGLFGRFDNWLELTPLAQLSAKQGLIIVMPEGEDAWYTDSATSKDDRHESFLIAELMPEIERRFRTIAERRGRAIAGLSMGGYGSFKIALKRPDLFALAGSFSGAFDPVERSDETPGFDWENLRPSILKAFGGPRSIVRTQNDLKKLIQTLPFAGIQLLPYFYFDCGNEDLFLAANRNLAREMTARGISHQFHELEGGHDWDYWASRLPDFLSLVCEALVLPQRVVSQP